MLRLRDIFLYYSENVSLREPERPATDPRNGEHIMAREKIKPNVKIRKSYKWRIERAAGILGGNEDGEDE